MTIKRSLGLNRLFPPVLFLLAFIIGMAGILGWVWNNNFLIHFLSAGASMKINTALLIIFLSLAGWLLDVAPARVPKILAGFAILLSVVIFLEHVLGTNLGVDEFFVNDGFTNSLLEPPGRSSALTVTCTFLLGVCILFSAFRYYAFAQLLGVTVLIPAYVSFLGHLFKIEGLYQLGRFSGLALMTTVSLLLIATGVLLSGPDQGWTTLLYKRFSKRKVLTFFVFYIGGVPLLFTTLYIIVIRSAAFSTASGILVLVVFSGIIILPLLWFIVNLFYQLGAEAGKARDQLAFALGASGMGVWELDLATQAIRHSDKFAALFSPRLTVIPNLSAIWDRCSEEDLTKGMDAFNRAVQTGALDLEICIINESKKESWLQFYAEKRTDAEGREHLLGTAMDITGRKMLERLKEEFLGIASHELRTPLTTLKGYLQIARRNVYTQPADSTAQMLDKADGQVTRLNKLITNLLDAGKAGSGLLTINRKLIRLDELITEIINQVPENSRSNIHLEHNENISVLADAAKIELVINHFLSNAMKFSGTNKNIIVSCTMNKGMATFSVANQGAGIKADELAKVFSRSYRSSDPAIQKIAGVGTGLYLSAEIIRLHHGTIWAESEYGKGAVFYFSIPPVPTFIV